jgi:hypothetical protein
MKESEKKNRTERILNFLNQDNQLEESAVSTWRNLLVSGTIVKKVAYDVNKEKVISKIISPEIK